MSSPYFRIPFNRQIFTANESCFFLLAFQEILELTNFRIWDQNAAELKDKIDSWNWTWRRHFDEDSLKT